MEGSGIADSGTDTTLVDAMRDEVDDHWNNYILAIIRGTNIGESRKVTDFVNGNNTITVSPAFTVAIDSTSEYVLSKETEDSELKSIRDDMEAYIDMELKNVGIAVPLSATNDNIKAICADLCAGTYMRRRAPLAEKNTVWDLGNSQLEKYIKANYGKGRFLRA